MDNIQRLEQQADYIANNLTQWEAESVARIARKCGKIGKLSKAEAEKFDTEREAKKEWERIVAALTVATALNIRSLKKAYTAEFEDWHTANKYLYDYRGIDFVEISKNKKMHGIIDDFVKQNGKDILNLTNTKALRVLDRNGTPILFQDEIYKAFSEAVGYVKDGRKDFHAAMRQTIQNLGGGGCKIDYGGGITRRLDTVVRQNMMYGVKQAHKEYNAIVGKELRCDGIEIDYHANARPSHRFMQGKQYSKGDAKTVNGVYYPSAEKGGVYARLYEDYNCYHYETDIILGVSEPRYSAEELRRLNERDKRLYKIGNIEKDGYGWSQSMRAIEADIRKSKDEINALSALGGNEAKIKELKNRIKTFQGKYDEISDITGIAKEKRRLSVVDGSKHKISSDIVKIKSRDGSAPINESFAKEILQETNKFEGKFGIVKGLKGINPKRYENDGIWGEYSDITGQINLYGIGGKEGRVNISNIAKKMYKDGKWSTNSPFHTLRHELSHCWLQSQKSLEGFNVKLQEIEKIKNNILSGLTGIEESDKIIMKNRLSIYGLEPNGEIDDFICECMAEYMTKNPRETSKQVMKILLGE